MLNLCRLGQACSISPGAYEQVFAVRASRPSALRGETLAAYYADQSSPRLTPYTLNIVKLDVVSSTAKVKLHSHACRSSFGLLFDATPLFQDAP